MSVSHLNLKFETQIIFNNLNNFGKRINHSLEILNNKTYFLFFD